MKLHYDPETDRLSIELAGAPGAQARQIVEGVVVDLDANGNVVGLGIDHASRKLDLSKVETTALPPVSAADVDDNARVARLTALLAGNGFALIKLFDLVERKAIPLIGAPIFSPLLLAGLAGAYVALANKPRSGKVTNGEVLSITVLVGAVLSWAIFTLYPP